MAKPRLFIGSSVAGLPIANAIKEELGQQFDVRVWDKDVFKLSYSNLENLMKALDETDFASLIFLPEDKLSIKGKETETVRDNVIFELGLFLGRLGRDKVSFAVPKDYDFHLLTDLAGITSGEFEYSQTDKKVDIKSYCIKIKDQIKALETQYPPKGSQGINALNKLEFELPLNCSARAIIPSDTTVKIRIQELVPPEVGGGGINSYDKWRVDRDADKALVLCADGPIDTDLILSFRGQGNGIMEYYENDILTYTKPFSWK